MEFNITLSINNALDLLNIINREVEKTYRVEFTTYTEARRYHLFRSFQEMLMGGLKDSAHQQQSQESNKPSKCSQLHYLIISWNKIIGHCFENEKLIATLSLAQNEIIYEHPQEYCPFCKLEQAL